MKDITGMVFGRLTVVKRVANQRGRLTLLCKCRCGDTCTVITAYALTKKGGVKTCRCCQDHIKYPIEYSLWGSMRSRCGTPTNKDYKNYGARGIKVCDRWKEDFLNFLEDMGKKPSPELSLDRIDNNGDYEPSNCRWATKSEQQLNKRCNQPAERYR